MRVLSELLFAAMVVPAGTPYTAFRLWQLWRGHTLVAAFPAPHQPQLWLEQIVLGVQFAFAAFNLGMLLAIIWPATVSLG